jgi:hypothetical protein
LVIFFSHFSVKHNLRGHNFVSGGLRKLDLKNIEEVGGIKQGVRLKLSLILGSGWERRSDKATNR